MPSFKSLKEQARDDLRGYDNPNSGRNPRYGNPAYLKEILQKYNMTELAALREWAGSSRKKNGGKYNK